jgi:hypothetical protein
VSQRTLILLELLLVFGATVGWGLWELWSLKRDRGKQKEEPGSSRD